MTPGPALGESVKDDMDNAVKHSRRHHQGRCTGPCLATLDAVLQTMQWGLVGMPGEALVMPGILASTLYTVGILASTDGKSTIIPDC